MSNLSQQYIILNNTQKKELFLESFFEKFNKYFGISKEELASYYDESIHSGYPLEPAGSIWEMEGKSIYCYVRCLKPKKILEIGNYKGRSTNHILQAVEKNGFGEVHLVDIEDRLEWNKMHNHNFVQNVTDSLQYLNNSLDFDCYIHDGCHEYLHVRKELELITKNTKNSFHIWSHDYFKVIVPQCEVKRAWDEFDSQFTDFLPMIDKYSDCGFLIAKYNKA